MADVLLFHHALGQTPGFHSCVDRLFADSSLPPYRAEPAGLLMRRLLDFLAAR